MHKQPAISRRAFRQLVRAELMPQQQHIRCRFRISLTEQSCKALEQSRIKWEQGALPLRLKPLKQEQPTLSSSSPACRIPEWDAGFDCSLTKCTAEVDAEALSFDPISCCIVPSRLMRYEGLRLLSIASVVIGQQVHT